MRYIILTLFAFFAVTVSADELSAILKDRGFAHVKTDGNTTIFEREQSTLQTIDMFIDIGKTTNLRVSDTNKRDNTYHVTFETDTFKGYAIWKHNDKYLSITIYERVKKTIPSVG